MQPLEAGLGLSASQARNLAHLPTNSANRAPGKTPGPLPGRNGPKETRAKEVRRQPPGRL